MKTPGWLLLATIAIAFGHVRVAWADTDCAALARQAFPDTTVTSASVVSTGQRFTDPNAGSVAVGRTICRVVAGVSTRPGEHVGIEVWMPVAGWNGRFEGLGSGGFGGAIFYGELVGAVARGFAAATTDTGHLGGTKGAVGAVLAWAHDPVQLRDWGHDAIHLMTRAAGPIVTSFYGHPARRSYFAGCSTGGSEAMEEAEFFPDDYDGIEASSPGNDYAHLMESFLSGGLLPARRPSSVLTAAKLQTLNRAVLRACGGEPAVRTGFLLDPPSCRFDPGTLLCRKPDRSRCLTKDQVDEAGRLYAPVRDPVSRLTLYPGFERGSETEWGLIQGALIPDYAQPLLANTVFGDPDWDWKSFDFHRDALRLDRTLSPVIDAVGPDLSRFARHGGKLIMTQGWADALNAQSLPIEYYDSVVVTRGPPAATDRFFRLFMVPGMSHCGHGPGPRTIGGDLDPSRPDPTHDVLAALTDWVEQGRAPEQFVATRPATGDTAALALPICRYPYLIRYRAGDPAQAGSYACATDPRRFATDLARQSARMAADRRHGRAENLPN